MKKIIILMGIFFISILLYGCKTNYAEAAGVYKLYEVTGGFKLSDYEYYTIELFEDQKAIVLQKRSIANAEEYKAVSTYEIKGDIIIFTTKVGFTNYKEYYSYINGEIHMINTEDSNDGIEFVAKFRREE